MKLGFAGTFDPITDGHMWVIEQARNMAGSDGVVILMPHNPAKTPGTNTRNRKQVVEAVIKDLGWNDVTVELIERDYTARAAKKLGVDYLIRGIRNAADFDYENQLHQANVTEVRGVPTLFVMPPPEVAKISSSYVKSFASGDPIGWHWIVQKMMPTAAYEHMRKMWLHKQWKDLWNYEHKDFLMQQPYEVSFHALISKEFYGDPSRPYHNLDHLVHGLCEIDRWFAVAKDINNADAGDFKNLKKAFWYHDAIYTASHGNEVSDEEASARLFEQLTIGRKESSDIGDYIRATDHFQVNNINNSYKHVLLGADLAILGQERPIYARYTKQIRREYKHFSEAEYLAGRIKALQYLVKKSMAGTLYEDEYFHDMYNHRACQNMSFEIYNNQQLLKALK